MGVVVTSGVVLQHRYEIVDTLGSGGQATVLEIHLLGALLAMRSSSLDRALRRLASDQQRLARALRALDGAPDFLSSTYSGRH